MTPSAPATPPPPRSGHRRSQSPGEEIANSVSHGVALLLGFVAAPFLIVEAAGYGDAAFLIGAGLFSTTMLVMYLCSSLYHALPRGSVKRLFRLLDHAAIFLLIAGTYTPFTLGVLRGGWGWTLLGLVWGLALVGIVLKALGRMRHPLLSNGVYLVMGWLVVIALAPLTARLAPGGLTWLLAGGLFYTAGVAFYALDHRLRYGHFIWHLFVIGGTVCHYFAVLWYAPY